MLAAAGMLGVSNQLWTPPTTAASAPYDVPVLGEARLRMAAPGGYYTATCLPLASAPREGAAVLCRGAVRVWGSVTASQSRLRSFAQRQM